MEEKPRRMGRHHRHDSDPFAELSDSIPELTDDCKLLKDQTDGALYERLIIGPLNMISFLLSLCLVNRQERAWRVSQHDNGAGSWLSKWFNAEPYQHDKDPTWHSNPTPTDDSSNIHGQHGNVPLPAVDSRIYHTNKKHREIAKLQLGDAFAMQNKVTFVLLAWALVALLGIAWMLHKLVRLLG
ncbi:hypothetical protein BDV97DRAFT_395775 [Delphinella strobiligena]|nr:hypothetical protein BDV97DRAFT_395775 [Delphinella strobiligena]